MIPSNQQRPEHNSLASIRREKLGVHQQSNNIQSVKPRTKCKPYNNGQGSHRGLLPHDNNK